MLQESHGAGTGNKTAESSPESTEESAPLNSTSQALEESSAAAGTGSNATATDFQAHSDSTASAEDSAGSDALAQSADDDSKSSESAAKEGSSSTPKDAQIELNPGQGSAQHNSSSSESDRVTLAQDESEDVSFSIQNEEDDVVSSYAGQAAEGDEEQQSVEADTSEDDSSVQALTQTGFGAELFERTPDSSSSGGGSNSSSSSGINSSSSSNSSSSTSSEPNSSSRNISTSSSNSTDSSNRNSSQPSDDLTFDEAVAATKGAHSISDVVANSTRNASSELKAVNPQDKAPVLESLLPSFETVNGSLNAASNKSETAGNVTAGSSIDRDTLQEIEMTGVVNTTASLLSQELAKTANATQSLPDEASTLTWFTSSPCLCSAPSLCFDCIGC